MPAIRASIQAGDYPRPQLVRDRWHSLDGDWEFGFDDSDVGLAEHWWSIGAPDAKFPLRIRVPFTFESELSGIGDTSLHSVVWYRTRFTREPASGNRVLVHFGAVDQDATVWVDGRLVGEHRGGQTAFGFDVTDALDATDSHVLVVRAEDTVSPDVPRGKQEWGTELHEIWYDRATGIWQTVWLEQVHALHIGSLSWQTDAENARVTATIELSRDPAEGAEMTVTVRLDERKLGSTRASVVDRRTVVEIELPELRNPHDLARLEWSPEHPVLLDAEIAVSVADVRVDRVYSYLGVRTAAVGPRAFLLNRRPRFIRAVLEQGYWPDGLWTAPSADALRREVELILQLGFTTVRIHQKIEDPRFLYWCDRLGLMVWGEIGAAYAFSTNAIETFTSEWMESVRQRRSHPSVVVWVPFNESWGVSDLATSPAQRDFVRGIVGLTRALDPSRPVVSNDGWEHVDSDIISIHDYAQAGASLRARYDSAAALADVYATTGPAEHRVLLEGQQTAGPNGELPVVLSEFGGVAFAAEGTWGYGVAADAESFETALRELFGAVVGARMLSGFCYTQLTDTAQEANGLLTADRVPKIPVDRLRAMIAGAPG